VQLLIFMGVDESKVRELTNYDPCYDPLWVPRGMGYFPRIARGENLADLTPTLIIIHNSLVSKARR